MVQYTGIVPVFHIQINLNFISMAMPSSKAFFCPGPHSHLTFWRGAVLKWCSGFAESCDSSV